MLLKNKKKKTKGLEVLSNKLFSGPVIGEHVATRSEMMGDVSEAIKL